MLTASLPVPTLLPLPLIHNGGVFFHQTSYGWKPKSRHCRQAANHWKQCYRLQWSQLTKGSRHKGFDDPKVLKKVPKKIDSLKKVLKKIDSLKKVLKKVNSLKKVLKKVDSLFWVLKKVLKKVHSLFWVLKKVLKK